PAVPAERAARVKEAVRAEWRAATAAPARGVITPAPARGLAFTRRFAALAAVLLAAVAIPLLRGWRPFPQPAATLARVEIGSPALPAGTMLSSGALLETRDGDRLALRLASGHSVRLDTGSRARLVSAGILELLEGAIYVDSGAPSPAGAAGRAVDIRTPAGTVQDIGTQFEVRLADAAVRVRVREGMVTLRRTAGPVEVQAGRELLIGPDGRASEAAIEDPGTAWAWTGEVAPMMAIDGRSLGEFLDWFGRERGLTIRYADADLAASAPGIRLSGSIEGMTLDEALASVLSISGLSHRLEGSTLSIERPSGAQ
ncbi:MAG TPA: FecR family protein, partial [Candidatus Polarisedimenticolia bacterium]|nr:FecR family protein [Candidatus Polarisedimenticolia bacterium]